MTWYPFDHGSSIGLVGSEKGEIIADEEYDQGARITIERNGHTPFSVTCGIYGLMCHTTFGSTFDEILLKYQAMKADIEKAIGLLDND